MWTLTVRSPSSSPVEYELKPGRYIIGRKPDNHIVINDGSASRLHTEIECDQDGAVIRDLDSMNGTFVNHKRITGPIALHESDLIRIGQQIISVGIKGKSAPHLLKANVPGTRPLTRDLLLESIDRNAVFLDSVTSRLTMIMDLEEAFKEISELSRLAVGADKAGIIPMDQFDRLAELELPEEITRQAIDLCSVVNVPDLALKPVENHTKTKDLAVIHAVLCVPVVTDQGVSAVIYAYRQDPNVKFFNLYDVQLAVAISHQAALTIQRARLIEESQMYEKLATIDSLTGIYNRRKIMQLAELEFQRARRFNHSFSMMIMDLDDLKKINDTHGHMAGDLALKSIAENSQKEMRVIDSIGRISGDEFILILIETPLKGARTAASRIQKRIFDRPIQVQNEPVQVSVCIGISSLDENTLSLEELLHQADRALMQAKRSGKNQVMAFSKVSNP